MLSTVNLAYYKKKEWRRFLEAIDDKDSMQYKIWIGNVLTSNNFSMRIQKN
jgi:hypothetical protein